MDSDTFERFSALDFSCDDDTQAKRGGLFGDYKQLTSGSTSDLDVQLVSALRKQHPELMVTSIPTSNVNLLQFAAAGFATAELDLDDETVLRWRGYIPPPQRREGGQGHLADATFFARYHYRWGQEDFILYTVTIGFIVMQYVLKEPRGGEKIQGHSRVTDALITTIGTWLSIEPDALYVFDRYWTKSVDLWKEVQKASWDKVILDPKMKTDLVAVCDTFFDSEDTYKEYGVPWKRGLIFHGPPGNGKTISIKALMHSMYQRKHKIPCLYVKSAPYTYMIEGIFALARIEAPCLLIFEDIDTIVTPTTRAYFFNEVDGVANNDGIMMIASTNYLDRLDPGLTKRPSRFDRKYLFPLPNRDERVLYAQYWQEKLKDKPIDFPNELPPAIADITDGFSFAYLQELFIASMLVIARGDTDSSDRQDKGGDDLDKYKLWRVLKRQADILREDMGTEGGKVSAEPVPSLSVAEPHERTARDHPFSVSGGGVRSRLVRKAGYAEMEERPRIMQSTLGRPVTSQHALNRVQKEQRRVDKLWEWDPPTSEHM